MIPATLIPTSIGLEKGPNDMRLGSTGLRKMKIEARIVPGNVIFKASLCTATPLDRSKTITEKKSDKTTEFTMKVTRAIKSCVNIKFSPFLRRLQHALPQRIISALFVALHFS